jgi:peptidoglycan/LPS O-acetylase OafA/YrhL
VSQEQKHLDLLDYTRATAIICVVAYHCLCAIGAQIYWNTWVRNLNVPISDFLVLPLNLGSLGVAVFFVVSGFCIHYVFNSREKNIQIFLSGDFLGSTRPIWSQFYYSLSYFRKPPLIFPGPPPANHGGSCSAICC